jgi:hypothetical protein
MVISSSGEASFEGGRNATLADHRHVLGVCRNSMVTFPKYPNASPPTLRNAINQVIAIQKNAEPIRHGHGELRVIGTGIEKAEVGLAWSILGADPDRDHRAVDHARGIGWCGLDIVAFEFESHRR